MTRRQLDRLLTLHIVQRILTIILLVILLVTVYLIVTRLHAVAAPMLAVPVLKMVHPDLSSDYDPSFFYPPSGPVVARGRHGLHGYAYGIGDKRYVVELLNTRMTWLVLMAPRIENINNWAKAEFPRAEVVGVYPDALDDALRHIARITRDWTEPSAAAAMEQARPMYRWAVARVHRPASIAAAYVRSLGTAPLDSWNALMADINTMDAPPAPAAAPAIDDVDAAHRAAQLALAERIQRQRKAARQRLRLEHRAIPVDWPTPITLQITADKFKPNPSESEEIA